ncbi:unnamed protein product [Caenorhabditis angaria]|uniref:Homeobox domain-containing protein n=1 Tax=Caenorhabditis angaria TaxID=860376 RepID=A0A9P1I7N1_9PELO|nr:unnamed protein product [Caenorhabditis angaria]
MSDFIRIIRIKNANGDEKLLEIPAKLDLERPKRPRTVFTDQQLQVLEKTFNESGYLNGSSRLELANKLGLSDNQIKVWFQNRRTKEKRKDATTTTNDSNPNMHHLFNAYLMNYWNNSTNGINQHNQ